MAVNIDGQLTNNGGQMWIGPTFNPLSLFAASEQGAWYDVSDTSTMFTTSAGTTQVTAVEQAVGLILDKSKGLTLGSELVISPYTGAVGGSWLISSSSVTRNGSSTSQATVSLNAAISTSKTYLVQFTVADLSGDTFGFRVGGGTAYQVSANGNYTARVIGGGTGSSIAFITWTGSAGQVTITNISVRELPGNHAYQSTDASRPILRARYNLLTYSEQFDNAVWNKFTNVATFVGTGTLPTITANYGVAPDGTQTADRLQFNLNGGTTSNDRSGTAILNITSVVTPYIASIYVKPLDATTDQQLLDSNIAIFTGGSTPTSTITNVGNGWKRLVRAYASGIAQATSNFRLQIVGSVSPQTMDLLIWGAQLVETAVFPNNTYQRIAAATDYATGPQFPQYLAFDGTDDSLLTASVDFSATDKMTVWAGLTKNGASSQGVVAELSATVGSNNGSFLMDAPPGVNNRYRFISKGTQLRDAETTDIYPPPQTVVVSARGDISGDVVVLKINAFDAASNTSDQGTGNFGNYPLYIGRRNNASAPFNGRLYQLVIRGAASTADQINAMETYIDNIVGAY